MNIDTFTRFKDLGGKPEIQLFIFRGLIMGGFIFGENFVLLSRGTYILRGFIFGGLMIGIPRYIQGVGYIK